MSDHWNPRHTVTRADAREITRLANLAALRTRIVTAAIAWYERDSAAVAADDELLELAKAVRAFLDTAGAETRRRLEEDKKGFDL